MRIVLNSHVDDPSSRAAIFGLHARLRARGVDATLNDWNGYGPYDVAVFLGYDHEIERARRENPRIRVALADPKQSRRELLEAARSADLLLVSSVEQRDVFLRQNRNVVVLYMFPPMRVRERIHTAREPIVIGYHGNRIHLECMYDGLKLALEELGRRRSIEFWAIYNIDTHGRARIGVPDEGLVPTRHIPWNDERAPDSEVSIVFYEELAKVDIGVVPSELPVRDRLRALEATAYDEPQFAYEPFDHLVRFKASANPGRLYPFAQLGIPVVADFFPSASQCIRDGESGFVVSSAYGWLEALETLADDPELRSAMARRLREDLEQAHQAQVDHFLEACERPLKPRPAPLAGRPSAEDELARWNRYPRPGGASRGSLALRVPSRVRRLVSAVVRPRTR